MFWKTRVDFGGGYKFKKCWKKKDFKKKHDWKKHDFKAKHDWKKIDFKDACDTDHDRGFKQDWQIDTKGAFDGHKGWGLKFWGWKADFCKPKWDCKVDWKGCKIKDDNLRDDCKPWKKKTVDVSDREWETCKKEDPVSEPETPVEPETPETPESPDAGGPRTSREGGNSAPEITLPENAALPINMNSTGRVVTKVKAVDRDAQDTLVFSINDANDPESPDADMFRIDSATGAVTLTGTPEAGGSRDGDSIYQIEVAVTDGALIDTQILEFTYFASA